MARRQLTELWRSFEEKGTARQCGSEATTVGNNGGPDKAQGRRRPVVK
jgi:hypothetical protein